MKETMGFYAKSFIGIFSGWTLADFNEVAGLLVMIATLIYTTVKCVRVWDEYMDYRRNRKCSTTRKQAKRK